MTARYMTSSSVEWTVLLYIGAMDNGQEKADETLIQQVITAAVRGTNADFVYQLVQSDGTLRGAIRPDGRNEILARGARIDVTNPEYLTDFVNWALRHFPSRYTAVFLKDHGNGWALEHTPARRRKQKQKGLGGLGLFYNGDQDTYMSTADLAPAIQETDAKRVDVFGFDACEMGAIEVAYEIQAVADFMIATESSESSSGWPYGPILQRLREHPGPIVPRELSREVVKLSGATPSLIALELDWIKTLAKDIDGLAKILTTQVSDVAPWLANGPAGKTLAGDIGQLAAGLQKQFPEGAINFAARSVLTSLARASPAEKGGLAIFLPVCSGSNDLASYGTVSFARNNHWTAFLSALNAELLQQNLCASASGQALSTS